MPTTTLTSKGQLTLPKAIREQTGIQTGDRMEVSATEDGVIHLRRLGGSVQALAGIARRPWHGPSTLEEIDASIREFLAEEDERTKSGERSEP